MTRNRPHSLFNRQTAEAQCYKDSLGLDEQLDSRRITVDEALAFFVHKVEIPAMRAGERYPGIWDPTKQQNVGGRLYEADHMLTLSYNLFAGITRVDSRNRYEPVIVSFVLDGSTRDVTNPDPGFQRAAVVRCSVRGVTQATSLDCAWRLHMLFSRQPTFTHTVKANCFDPTLDERIKTDLSVHRLVPQDEPRIAEQEANRVHVLFRLDVSYTRNLR